jgi:betaine lipid synthase
VPRRCQVYYLTSRDEYLPLTYFDKVYLIDLCEPLLEVARARCQQKGWKNVICLCQDASRFVLPEWESGELDPKESLSVITMSYSLSMVSLSTETRAVLN